MLVARASDQSRWVLQASRMGQKAIHSGRILYQEEPFLTGLRFLGYSQ